MEEKTKKILGLVSGLIAPGIIAGFAMPLIFLIGFGAYIILTLLIIILFPMILGKYIGNKFYFMGLAINVLGLLAGGLVFLGACAEHPFMGSAQPGAGTPFFIAAAVALIFSLVLLIISIKVLSKSKDEPEMQKTLESA